MNIKEETINNFKKMFLLLLILLMSSGTSLAHEDDGKKGDATDAVTNYENNSAAEIPEQVPCEHWAYKEVKELGENTQRKRSSLKGRPVRKPNYANALFL